MPRKSARSVTVDPNVRCLRLYPVEGSTKSLADLKTIGIRLTREQAIHLARVLLTVSHDWPIIDITGYRTAPRKSDGTYMITVTHYADD